MNFTRLRLSSSPAVSPNIIDAPSSPTKSVYLDMDETTPTSPQMPSYPYTLSNDTSERTPTTTTATSKPAGTATNAPTAGPSIRRTNFFDSDSSSDDDDEDNDELTTADGLAFSQRHSLVSPLLPLLPDDDDDGGEDDNRGRPLTRSPPPLLPSPSIFSSSKQHPANDHHRKGAYYLGVRPEEYAFVCGTRPTSSVGDEGASSYHVEQGRGFDGYTRYDVPTASSSSSSLPPPLSSPPLTASKKQRQTLRPEGVSPKHVPFGAPDLAVAARRVLAERDQRRGRKTREKMGMGGVAEFMLKGRASSSVLGPSASEYEDQGRGRGRGGGENAAELSKGRPLSYGGEEADVGMSSPGNHGGKENAAAARRSDALEEGLHDGGPAETQSVLSKTDDNILGVHAITLQALLRDEEGLQASASSVRRKSASSEFSRKDIQKLHGRLSQQPRDSATSLPPPVPEIPPIVQIQQPKRVAMVPPPIDTSRSRGSRSDSKVKTPYPFHHHKNLPKTLGSPGIPGTRAKDIVLTLSIHRRSGVLSSRVARVTLPAELLEGNYHAANGSCDDIAPDEKPPPVFDDAAFFKELRTEYARLAGRWWRFFSARTLSRITVGHTTAWSATESCPGPAACGGGRCCPAARAAHGGGLQQQQRGCSAATPSGIYHVRSPRFLASQGLKDTFSEENLLAHFRSPRMGRSRFAWVLWASRLAGLHEQPEPSTWRARQQQQQQKGANWRERELPPTPGAGAAGKWVDTSGRTPSTASTAFAGGGSDNGSKDNVVEDTAMAELGLAGGIGPGHNIATLEFVEGWSITRILAAVLLVLLLAAAGIVLWILFGSGILVDGFRGSGARVGTAVLIGAGVLLFGWTLVLAWMGVSWCVV